ncbi:hypothetical protein DVA69_18325, partial [Acinetobacter baumannii]
LSSLFAGGVVVRVWDEAVVEAGGVEVDGADLADLGDDGDEAGGGRGGGEAAEGEGVGGNEEGFTGP